MGEQFYDPQTENNIAVFFCPQQFVNLEKKSAVIVKKAFNDSTTLEVIIKNNNVFVMLPKGVIYKSADDWREMLSDFCNAFNAVSCKIATISDGHVDIVTYSFEEVSLKNWKNYQEPFEEYLEGLREFGLCPIDIEKDILPSLQIAPPTSDEVTQEDSPIGLLKKSKTTYVHVIGRPMGVIVPKHEKDYDHDSFLYNGYIEVPYSYEDFISFNAEQQKAVCSAELFKLGFPTRVSNCNPKLFYQKNEENN